jgi:hypothetical protein
MRSSNVRLLCVSSMCVQSGVRVAVPEFHQYANFKCFHFCCIRLVFMRIALQVQDTMHGEMRVVRFEFFFLCAGFPRNDRCAKCEVALIRRNIAQDEGEYVCRIILASVATVERSSFLHVDKANCDEGVVTQSRA